MWTLSLKSFSVDIKLIFYFNLLNFDLNNSTLHNFPLSKRANEPLCVQLRKELTFFVQRILKRFTLAPLFCRSDFNVLLFFSIKIFTIFSKVFFRDTLKYSSRLYTWKQVVFCDHFGSTIFDYINWMIKITYLEVYNTWSSSNVFTTSCLKITLIMLNKYSQTRL